MGHSLDSKLGADPTAQLLKPLAAPTRTSEILLGRS